VLGVLIALGGVKSVEALHWRHKPEDAEDSMHFELRDDEGPQALRAPPWSTASRDNSTRFRVQSSMGATGVRSPHSPMPARRQCTRGIRKRGRPHHVKRRSGRGRGPAGCPEYVL